MSLGDVHIRLGIQTDKIPRLRLQPASLLPSSQFPLPAPAPSTNLAPPLADIFTPASVGSQQGQSPVNSLD